MKKRNNIEAVRYLMDKGDVSFEDFYKARGYTPEEIKQAKKVEGGDKKYFEDLQEGIKGNK